jgi:hypothetical protein
MFGIPIAGPANLYRDNDSVVNYKMKPESAFKKKHNVITIVK